MTKQASPDAAPPRKMLYENLYVWLVFVSAMDVMLTWIVLHRGGLEANAIARWVLARFELAGMVVFKFALVILVIVLCELIGRRNAGAGRNLARAGVVLTAAPVALAFYLLLTR